MDQIDKLFDCIAEMAIDSNSIYELIEKMYGPISVLTDISLSHYTPNTGNVVFSQDTVMVRSDWTIDEDGEKLEVIKIQPVYEEDDEWDDSDFMHNLLSYTIVNNKIKDLMSKDELMKLLGFENQNVFSYYFYDHKDIIFSKMLYGIKRKFAEYVFDLKLLNYSKEEIIEELNKRFNRIEKNNCFDSTIRFSVSVNKGLYRIDAKTAPSVIEDLLNIKGDTLNLIDFIKSNGFFFPNYNKCKRLLIVETDALLALVDRFVQMFELQTIIAQLEEFSIDDYDSLLEKIIYLLFPRNYIIKTPDGKDNNTCNNRFWRVFKEIEYTIIYNRLNHELSDESVVLSILKKEMEYYDPFLGFDDYYNDSKHTSVRGFIDELYSCYDYAKKYKMHYDGDMFYEFMIVVEFIKMYEEKIGKIHRLGKRIYHFEKKQTNCKDEIFKQLLLYVSKIILNDEFRYYFHDIQMGYSRKTLTPVWRINSLISAIYYGLAYYNTPYSVERVCPCGKKFLVSPSSRKKYCSEECQVTMAERRKREMRAVKKQEMKQNPENNKHFRKVRQVSLDFPKAISIKDVSGETDEGYIYLLIKTKQGKPNLYLKTLRKANRKNDFVPIVKSRKGGCFVSRKNNYIYHSISCQFSLLSIANTTIRITENYERVKLS